MTWPGIDPKTKHLFRAVKRWWKDPYYEVSCPRHGTVQVVRASHRQNLTDRCPLCRGLVAVDLREPTR